MTLLGDVAEFVRGVTFKPSDVLDAPQPDAVQVMRTKNIQATLDLSDVIQIPKRHIKREKQFLRTGDILVSSANSWNLVGKCCWVPELEQPAAIGGFVTALRADQSRLNPRYLYHWFSSAETQAVIRSFGNRTTSISNLSLKRCEVLPLPLPPRDEQRRIADILDRTEHLRAQRRHSLALLDDLTDAVFREMLGPTSTDNAWPVVTVAALLSAPLRNGISPATDGEVGGAVLTLSAVTGTAFRADAVKAALFARPPQASQRVNGASLLICRGNGNKRLVGRGFFPEASMPEVAFPDTMIAAQIDTSRVNRRYLQQIWNSPSIRSQLESAARTTNGTYKINQEMIEAVSLALPELAHQEAFAERIAVVEQLRARHAAQLDQLNQLVSSLQHRAFRGEL